MSQVAKNERGLLQMKKSKSVGLVVGLLSMLVLGSPVTVKATSNPVYVTTTGELQTALKTAQPGDDIVIAAGTYVGKLGVNASGHGSSYFNSDQEGTAENPITVRSEDPRNPALLEGQRLASGNVLRITGDHWVVKDLQVTFGQKGIMLDNSNHTKISNVKVFNISMEGIHFRDGSSYNLLENSQITETGVERAGYGEGVYVGSAKSSWATYKEDAHYNTIRNNVIGPNVAAESIDIKEGTLGTLVEGNTFLGEGISGQNYADSFIDIKGNEAMVRNNKGYQNQNKNIVAAVQLSNQLDNWGNNNRIQENTFFMDDALAYLVTAGKNSSGIVANNQRTPEGNMYSGNLTVEE